MQKEVQNDLKQKLENGVNFSDLNAANEEAVTSILNMAQVRIITNMCV